MADYCDDCRALDPFGRYYVTHTGRRCVSCEVKRLTAERDEARELLRLVLLGDGYEPYLIDRIEAHLGERQPASNPGTGAVDTAQWVDGKLMRREAGSYSASAPVTVSREAWDALQRGARG